MLTRHFIAMTLALAAVAAACSESDGGTTTTTTTPSSTVTTHGATLSLACTEEGAACPNPQTVTSSVAASTLYLCNYWDTTQAFQVEFQTGTTDRGILVEIAGFTGAGSYTTNAAGTTNVTVTTDANQADAAGVVGSIPEHPCTIGVVSNLSAITIPDSGDAPLLDVELDVSCPSLGDGAVCPIECTVSPASFKLSVAGCLVSQ
ncbi:MAG: hypothetical protein HY908_07830 [Myxococcales bacterium]|nr:hypothetical protein [Myxococcales bacterium]